LSWRIVQNAYEICLIGGRSINSRIWEREMNKIRWQHFIGIFLIIGILSLAACSGIQDPVAGPDDGQNQSQENMAQEDTSLAGAAGTEEEDRIDFVPERLGPPVGMIVLVVAVAILVIIGAGVWLSRRNSTT